MKPKIVAIIQARMSSSRLPGKVLLDIAGKPMLKRVIDRVRLATSLDEVVVATTKDSSDDAVQALCEQFNFPFYRGSLLDVLDRYYQAAYQFKAQVVVRVTGDCPIIDPGLIDDTVAALLGRPISGYSSLSAADVPTYAYDFTATRLPAPWHRTYPIGLDVEVCTFDALARAWREGDQPHHREHVMPYLYEQEGRFRVHVLNHDPDFGSLRWTVDTAEDLEVLKRILAYFPGNDAFSWLDVLEVVKRQPELSRLNAQVNHHDYRDVDARRSS